MFSRSFSRNVCSKLHQGGLMQRRHITKEVKGPWNFVNGQRCQPVNTSNCIEVLAPATNALLCSVPVSGKVELDGAVAAARKAQCGWRKKSGEERGAILTKAASIITENLEDIARLEVLDTGKPIWEARVDIASCAESLEYYGMLAGTVFHKAIVTGEEVLLAGGDKGTVVREPLGVVAGIGAWNFPMQTATWKVAPALACGNTVVYKPSQFTPVTAVTLAEALTEAGAGEGVVNIVQGAGETGSLLSSHCDVDCVSFTGSVPTGVKVFNAVAPKLKQPVLELGGKSPLIIFDDSDVDNAVKGALMANFLSQGQVCSNGTRVFVQSKIYDRFVARLVEKTLKLKIGNPMGEDTTVGATIHEEHAKKVLAYVEEAVKEGCVLLCGGKRQTLEGELGGGWYLEPAILDRCADHMKVVREEVFGSVLALLVFDCEEEVVARANDTTYGLAGGVFTGCPERFSRVASSLQCGTVWHNTYNLYPPQLPFGGYKMSGLGRENGEHVMEHMMQTKTLYRTTAPVDCGLLWTEDS